MKRSRRKTLVVLLLVALVVFAWTRWRGAEQAATEQRGTRDPGLLVDRLWIDSKPEKYTDYAHVLFALSAAPIGVFQQASAYRATSELFEFKRQGDRLRFYFPQSDRTVEVGYSVHDCDELPPFDLCLDLAENPWGGPRRYYGLADPDQESARFGELRHRLEHQLR